MVPVNSPIQVVIVYGTATVDGTGKVYFYDDIYGNDKRLARALAAGYPYRW
jgi:murein L,D-transpeptidase YcbB/YkuD